MGGHGVGRGAHGVGDLPSRQPLRFMPDKKPEGLQAGGLGEGGEGRYGGSGFHGSTIDEAP